ncbi:cysteine desulfurase [Candidatus Woesearchaeota archaeon]|nr:cysteine desulfurase [Candidatus Woesearchaeota archaeon]
MSDFPILKDIVYLDNASTTQKPLVVIEAVKQYYEKYNANIHRGVYSLSEHSTLLFENARKAVSEFVNAECVVFTKSATEGLNLVAKGLPLIKGDEVILTDMEHHSNILPWQQVAKEKGIILKFARVKNFSLDVDHLVSLFSPKTKVVSICHVSNVLGCENPIKEISRIAHSNNALIVIDASQSVPHMTIDVKELGADFLVFSGHKMLAPMGVGVLCGKKKCLEMLSPLVSGGGGIKNVEQHDFSLNDVPDRLEAGTPNVASVVGLAAAIEYLKGIGMEKVTHQVNWLTDYALKKLSSNRSIVVFGGSNGVISFGVDGVHSHDVCSILDQKNICVRGGHHCAMLLMKQLGIKDCVRASFYFYNTKDDVDKLADSLSLVKEVLA